MAESQRIAALLSDLYNGKPWIDINILDTVKSLNAQQAARKIGNDWNSTWQIINHLIDWRSHLLENFHGGDRTSPTSDAAWQTTLEKLETSQHDWQKFLRHLDDNALNETMAGHKFTNYQYLHGIVQHDAYHLGQIAMLVKHI
jgi:uncharacterized damage-inducible protein DinB